MSGRELVQVADDELGFYGREYWFGHQEKELGFPNIQIRARTDLAERCLYWLRTALKYKHPPGQVLELGSAHGGFVALLRWAGFDATGLELSPWVVQFARKTFGVPVLLGPVEDQQIEPASLDMIALMDVLEHLTDPVGTMRHCLELLKPNGILLIQTPCLPEGRSHENMVAQGDRFVELLIEKEHLYLFSQRSIKELFARLGAEHVVFEPALFAYYDMFLVVSRAPLVVHRPVTVERALSATSSGRMVQALLGLGGKLDDLKQRYAEAEQDRAARLQVIEAQGRLLGEVEAERNRLRGELEVVEADRAARLEVIEAQGRLLGEVEAERNKLRARR
jgi:2-polyprenyl-3-methyl-5-hydroxy-6-metoxy-1,4-benzoquinol methylase